MKADAGCCGGGKLGGLGIFDDDLPFGAAAGAGSPSAVNPGGGAFGTCCC